MPVLIRKAGFWFAVVVTLYLVLLAARIAGAVQGDVFSVPNRVLSGAVVSFLFYYLVVRLPELRRRAMVSETLLHEYRAFEGRVERALESGDRKDLAHAVSLFTHQFRSALGSLEVREPELYRSLERFETVLTEMGLVGDVSVEGVRELVGDAELEGLIREL